MQENILDNLEKNYITSTIFCDLSKAFDTIDHDVLLWKLDNFFGIRGLPLKLLASYLQGRQQYTAIDGCTSGIQPKGSLRAHCLAPCYLHFI